MEEVGGHLIKRQVFEPHWSKASGAVRAWERGTLYGLVIYPRRGMAYRDIDPALCREALHPRGPGAGRDRRGRRAMAFLAHNQRLVAEIERLEHKSRRPDVLVDRDPDRGLSTTASSPRRSATWRAGGVAQAGGGRPSPSCCICRASN